MKAQLQPAPQVLGRDAEPEHGIAHMEPRPMELAPLPFDEGGQVVEADTPGANSLS